MGAVAAICLRPNWWGNDFGRQMMYGCLREESVDVSEYATEAELVVAMDEVLFATGGVDAWTASSAIKARLQEEFRWSLKDVHAWLLGRFDEHSAEPWQHELTTAFERATPDMTRFGDENWNYIARYLFAVGRNPDTWPTERLTEEIASRVGLIARIRDIAESKLGSGDVVIPPWAYDGLHVSGRAGYGWADRRFPGTLDAFENCLKMVERYGRLDPRDQGIGEGCQVPDEGLVLCNEFLDDEVV
jgi:hypothetical protein